MIIKTETFSYERRLQIFWTLISIIAICLALYVVTVNLTVRNTVARQILERETMNQATYIGELEFSYIALKNKVSLELAYERGFKEVVSPVYISKSTSRSLTLNR